MWLVYLVFVFFLAYPLLNNPSSVEEITWKKFDASILRRHAVDHIEMINGEKANIYLKKSMSADPAFKEAFKTAFGKDINEGPHYKIAIGTLESFERRLDEAQKAFKDEQKIDIRYVKENNWLLDIVILDFSILSYILLLAVFIEAFMGCRRCRFIYVFFWKIQSAIEGGNKSVTTFDDV